MEELKLSEIHKGGVLADVRVVQSQSNRANEITPGGGKLRMSLSRHFREISETRAAFEVSLRVEGVPNTPAKAPVDFSVSISVQSFWVWKAEETVDFANIKTLSCFYEPAYLIGVEKLRDAGRQLGFGALKIPYDLNVLAKATDAGATKSSQTKSTRKKKASVETT